VLLLQSILVMLKDEEEMQQLTGLTELCEFLSISTEDTLAAFPTEQVVPLLVGAASRPPPARLPACLTAYYCDCW
jgi:E3 ubiquitin-protein ligase TRIP12